MFSQTEYLGGWIVYGIAAFAGCLLVWVWTLNWRPAVWRAIAMITVVAVLCTPVANQPGSEYWSPAFVVAIYDVALEHTSAVRALTPMATLATAGLLIALIVSLIRRH